jgi:hypothetical protein
MKFLILLLASCAVTDYKPISKLEEKQAECFSFSDWKEVPSPFVGERCFVYTSSSGGDARIGGPICKKADDFVLDVCADPYTTEIPVSQ